MHAVMIGIAYTIGGGCALVALWCAAIETKIQLGRLNRAILLYHVRREMRRGQCAGR